MKLTPNHIDVILHFNRTPSPHPNHDAPAVIEAVDFFVNHGMLLHFEGQMLQPGSCYEITEKGRFWVKKLCETPLPVQVWI